MEWLRKSRKRPYTCVQDGRFRPQCQKKVVPRGPDHPCVFCEELSRNAVTRAIAAPHCPGGRRLSRISTYVLWITALAFLPPTSSLCATPFLFPLLLRWKRSWEQNGSHFPKSLSAGWLQWNKDCLSVEMLMRNPTQSVMAAVWQLTGCVLFYNIILEGEIYTLSLQKCKKNLRSIRQVLCTHTD